MIPENLAESRWWPPSPHREEIMTILARGRAHLEAQGHGQPPLLVYEDGGAMELPKVRYVEGQFTAADGSEPEHQTTLFLDVCGTVDELKRLLREKPPEATPENFQQLLDDAGYMLARMQERLRLYADFARQVQDVAARLQEIQHPDIGPAEESLENLRALLRTFPAEVEQPGIVAERVRDVANQVEPTLYAYRDAAIELGALYEEIRGARKWEKK